MPAGAETPTTTELERYGIGADVAGGYACAWITAYVDGDAAARDEAVRVLATARQWPVLLEMRDEGGYVQVLWQVAREVAQGTVPPEWREGIGC
ncbi:hypothetical protein [Nocardioides sp. 1609]|uniref:hypothetical protein n=1 Tax=Nocardioides sp. 1609 TaxID=2508327 RepID=UPI0014322371|nr:hypothetical protein [Nocardioides sp. 1609]